MVDPVRWRAARVVARVEPVVEAILAEHARTFWQRGLRRRELVWTIDREPVAELRIAERGPATLVVHDFSVYEPLRRSLRTRHVRVRLATARDTAPPAG